MKKNTYKHLCKKLPIFPGTLNIIITKDFNKALTALKIPGIGINTGHDYSDCFGLSWENYENKKQYYFILLKPNFRITTAAHEAKHITNFIIKYIEAKLDINNDEFECYILSYVCKQIEKTTKLKDQKYV